MLDAVGRVGRRNGLATIWGSEQDPPTKRAIALDVDPARSSDSLRGSAGNRSCRRARGQERKSTTSDVLHILSHTVAVSTDLRAYSHGGICPRKLGCYPCIRKLLRPQRLSLSWAPLSGPNPSNPGFSEGVSFGPTIATRDASDPMFLRHIHVLNQTLVKLTINIRERTGTVGAGTNAC